ncbi:MMPL family transporter, partial [Candidatus Bipolaricaulota bacterium]
RGLLAQFALLQYGASLNGLVGIAFASSDIFNQLREIQLRLDALDAVQAQASVAALRAALETLDSNLVAVRDLPAVETLLRDILLAYPEGIRSRYLTSDGDFIVQARVSRAIFDGGNLASFNRFVASFSDDYFGMPLVAQRLEDYMKRDFFLSTGLAAVLILVVLRGSLRGWVRALLAATPLVLGYIWMLGGMRLFSIDFNFLSITISPLLIGIGVDNGIHILHRTIEERLMQPEGAVERGASMTAVAVIVTSLTTMLVFGSLLAARTPGLRMLGVSALLGIGFSLVFSLLFLPAALHVEGGRRV